MLVPIIIVGVGGSAVGMCAFYCDDWFGQDEPELLPPPVPAAPPIFEPILDTVGFAGTLPRKFGGSDPIHDPPVIVPSYHLPPDELPGFPEYKRVRGKTPIPGGGGIRARWRGPKGDMLEWDYQHGTVEKYNKRGRHQGEYDRHGRQSKPANPGRRIEP